MKIFLIGMPGSGKTTLGRQLADHLRISFVDLDSEIEEAEGCAISEIFKAKGEEYFRMVEARLLRELAGTPRSFVMATGGGAPCFHKGMELINEYGLTVFLDCPVSQLIERVKKNQERPLLVTDDEGELRRKLEALRKTRLSCYQQAKIILERPSLPELLKHLGPKK